MHELSVSHVCKLSGKCWIILLDGFEALTQAVDGLCVVSSTVKIPLYYTFEMKSIVLAICPRIPMHDQSERNIIKDNQHLHNGLGPRSGQNNTTF